MIGLLTAPPRLILDDYLMGVMGDLNGLEALFYWLAERLHDAAAWPINLVRDLPRRVGRLLRLALSGLKGLPHLLVELGQKKPNGWATWSKQWGRAFVFGTHQLLCYLFDLIGGPELAQFFMHLVMPTTSLTVTEMGAVAQVLGPVALRFGEVRVAQGGILPFIFRRNGARAFALWHTIHLPARGREDLSLIVHEVTHIYQYEQIGSIYIGEALHAQWTLGRGAYHYGGAEGLRQAHHSGKPYKAYTREQQAQIAQDYYLLSCRQDNQTQHYTPYIQALQKGQF